MASAGLGARGYLASLGASSIVAAGVAGTREMVSQSSGPAGPRLRPARAAGRRGGDSMRPLYSPVWIRAVEMSKPSERSLARFKAVAPGGPEATERLMFGQPCAVVHGNMFMGLFGEQ